MQKLKLLAHSWLKKAGYDLNKYPLPLRFGQDAYNDMRHLLRNKSSPMIFDVGANIGQSVETFKRIFPNASVHCFEPGPRTFEELKANTAAYQKVSLWNCAIGSAKETLPFKENSYSDMSSFLEPSKYGWGEVEKITDVPVITLDDFAAEQNIRFVDVLKSDTQGFEYEVFKGAQGLMKEGKIGLIYFEQMFLEMYKGLTPFHEILRLLTESDFALVSVYKQNYLDDRLCWTDVTFIHKDYSPQRQ